MSYELEVASYELLFIARVTSYFLTYKLRVITYCTSYELTFTYELRVTIYCTSWDCNVDCVVSVLYQLFSYMTCSLQNQVFLVRYS